jgi:hypothetical protein
MKGFFVFRFETCENTPTSIRREEYTKRYTTQYRVYTGVYSSVQLVESQILNFFISYLTKGISLGIFYIVIKAYTVRSGKIRGPLHVLTTYNPKEIKG